MQVSFFTTHKFSSKGVLWHRRYYIGHVCDQCHSVVPTKPAWLTDEPEVSKEIVKLYDMATTLEALAAAVYMDGASQEQCHKVYTRFGLQHRLLDPPERLWIWKMVRSRLNLPEKFFIGHHCKLQEGIFQTQLKHFPAQKKKNEAGLWERAQWLWRRTKRLGQQTGSVDSLAERTQSAGTRTKDPPLDVATSETEVIGEDSAGRCEDVEQTAAPERTADEMGLAKKREAEESTSAAPERTADERGLAKKREAEESTSAAPTSSKPRRRRRRPAPSKEDTSTDDVGPAETGSENSSTASRNRPAPKTSSKDVAAAGVDMKVENQSHKTLEADLVEAIKEVDSEEGRKRLAEELATEVKMLDAACRKLRLAGGPKSEEGKQKLKDMQQRRKLVVDKRSVLLQPLNRQS